jgi:iron complex outermembrane receptor protein
MPRRLWFLITFVAAMLTLSPGANAFLAGQSSYGQTTVQGAVADGSGAPIANASVVLKDGRLKVVARVTTDNTGHYEIKIPASGIYNVTITAATFGTLVFENLRLPDDSANLPDATLHPGTAIVTVNVNAIEGLAGGQIAMVGHVGILGDVLLEDVPFSVQSYTNTFLENQQALSLTDVLESDAAFASQAAPSKASQLFDVYLVRGFREEVDRPAAINGLFGLYGWGRPNMEFVERVDVFHGPSAFLMGAPDSVGGVVNMAPKRAKDAPLLVLEPTYLSKTVYGGHVDASDRVGTHKAFGGRVNGMYRDGEGAIRDSRLLNGGVAVGLDYRSKFVLLSLDMQYLRDYNRANQHVVIPGPGVTLLPPAMPNDLSTEPVWMYDSFNQKIVLGRADFNLSPDWTATTASGASRGVGGAPTYCPIILLDNLGSVLCNQISQLVTPNNVSNDVGIRGKFRTGHFAHSFVAGWNRVQQTTNFAEGYDAGPSQPYNLYLPYRPTSPNFVTPKQPTDYQIDNQNISGWYLGDTIGTLRGRLLLTGGFRRSTVGVSDTFRDDTPPFRYRGSAFSPSVAGLVQLTPHASLYGNFIQALQPGAIAPPDTKNAGEVFPPAISNQIEGGAKMHFNTWTGTVAFYRISQAYATESTATNPPTFTQNGRQVNKGIEIGFAGDIIPTLHAIVSTSFINSQQHSTGIPETEGKSVASIAGATERLNVIWELPHFKNLALICSVMETGTAPYDDANTFRVPAWRRLDLGARYSFGHEKPLILRAQVENLPNSKFWASAFSGGLAVAGPRVINLSISKAF